MKRSLIVGGGVLAVVLLAIVWWISAGNSLIRLDEAVNQSLAQVDNVYQRRADLIPNLVKTVERFAKHEKSVLVDVTQARAQVGQVKINSPADLQGYAQKQAELSSALSRLMVVAEKYPDLKADKNFLELQSQLEGTENRIAVERMRLNETIQAFNSATRVFPGSMIAASRGLKERPYFQAEASAKTAPQVQFEQ